MADFGSFLSNVALGAGQNIMYQQAQEERQAKLNDLRSQTQARQANSQLLRDDFLLRSGIAQRTQQAQEQKAQFMQNLARENEVRDTAEKSPMETALQQAQIAEKNAMEAGKRGYTAEAEEFRKQADTFRKNAEGYGKIIKDRQTERVDKLGAAAQNVLKAIEMGGLTPEIAQEYNNVRLSNGMPPFEGRSLDGKSGYTFESNEGKAELTLQVLASEKARKIREAEAKIEKTRENQEAQRVKVEDQHKLTQGKISQIGNKRNGGAVTMSEDEIKSAGAMAATGMPLTQVVPGSRADVASTREAVRAEAIKQIQGENPEMSAATAGQILADKSIAYRARSAGATARARTAGTTVTNLEIAGNEARAMIDVAKQYADQVNAVQFRSLNQLENYVAANTGDVEIVKLKGALNSLVNSYARAISPKGTPTVSDKNHAREVIDAAMSRGQLEGAFEVMGQEMDAAHKAATGVEKKSGTPVSSSVKADDGWVKLDGGWSVREKK